MLDYIHTYIHACTDAHAHAPCHERKNTLFARIPPKIHLRYMSQFEPMNEISKGIREAEDQLMDLTKSRSIAYKRS